MVVSSAHAITFAEPTSLLYLMQLASSALPVGAYSYSEGLEFLVETQTITSVEALEHWIQQELRYGSMRLETVAIARAYAAMGMNDPASLAYWNQWLSAIRDTRELREQSWQMGQALVRLVGHLEPELTDLFASLTESSSHGGGVPCNFAIGFGITAAHWHIDLRGALLGYLHSWMSNLVNAGIKLIPLGQTAGQSLLIQLYPHLCNTVDQCLEMKDEDLYSCNWGMAIASMNHETLYSRLFRS